MKDPDTGEPWPTTIKGEWKYWYDARGNLRVQEDPKADQHLQFCYDNLSRPQRKYIFDDADYVASGSGANLVSCSSPQNEPPKVVSYEYDGYQEGQDEGIDNSVGQLTFVSDPSGETLFDEFDVRGRLLDYRKRIAFGSSLEQARFQYSYDVADHLDVLTYPDMEQVRYGYDESGQPRTLKSLTYAGSSSIYLADLTYDRFGRPRQISHGNTTSSDQVGGAVVAETREYWGKEKNFLLWRLTVAHSTGTQTAPTCGTSSDGPYLQLTYTDYTATNQLKSVSDVHQSCADLSNKATYTYDALGRLTAITGSQFNGSYVYNALGNMEVMSGATFLYDNAARPHQVTAALGQSIEYDSNGNRKASGGHDYDFDEEDRLISIDAGVVDVTYDYSGRQVLRQAGSAALRYFDPLAEYEAATARLRKHYFVGSMRLATRESGWAPAFIAASGWPTVMVASLPQSGAGVVLLLDERAQRYLGLALVATVLCLAMIPGRRRRSAGVRLHPRQAALMTLLWTLGTLPVPLVLLPLSAGPAFAGGGGVGPGGGGLPPLEYYHYHGDHLGSTQVITDEVGRVKQHIRYKPFGEPRGRYKANLTSDANSKRFEFTGYETETYSGLQYAGARFYEPELGMFLSHDPARQFANPYTYTNWNPVNLTDPSGAYVEWGVIFTVAIIFAVAAANAAAIDAYAKTGDPGSAAKAFAISTASSAAGPNSSGLQMVAPKEFGRFSARDTAISYIPVAGSVYGAAQSFASGNYATGIVGVAAAVYAAYGLYSAYSSATDSTSQGANSGTLGVERGSLTDSEDGTIGLLKACNGGNRAACGQLEVRNAADLEVARAATAKADPYLLTDPPRVRWDGTIEFYQEFGGATEFWTGEVTLSRGYPSRAGLVESFAHELGHAKSGVIGRALTNIQDEYFPVANSRWGLGRLHNAINQRAELVRIRYEVGPGAGR